MNSETGFSRLSRRNFHRATLAATVGTLGAGRLSRAIGYRSPNERPRIAVVGCGSRWGWQLANGGRYGVGGHFAKFGDYVLVCDVDEPRREAAQRLVKEWSGNAPEMTADYREVIDRDDIDAVLVFTPDHWHAKVAIEAMLSGKDVYCEKPMTLTIEEGQQICKVCRDTERIFQVGTQQRSTPGFRTAIALVRDGRLGELQRVECGIGGGPTSPEIPVAKAPASLDWNQWLGPAPETDFRFLAGANNETKSWSRCHYEFRWWYEYSGGKLTDWGAHHVDIATWAMGKTETGPVRIEPLEIEHPVPYQDGYPTVADQYNTATKFRFQVSYQDGPPMIISSDARNGILLEGSEGRIFVNRGGVQGAPVEALADQPLSDDAQQMIQSGRPADKSLGTSPSAIHIYNFFQSVTDRSLPHSDVFSHHRALSTCHLAAISGRLGRAIQWDPEREVVVDDPQAAALVGRDKRVGFEIQMG